MWNSSWKICKAVLSELSGHSKLCNQFASIKFNLRLDS